MDEYALDLENRRLSVAESDPLTLLMIDCFICRALITTKAHCIRLDVNSLLAMEDTYHIQKKDSVPIQKNLCHCISRS